jgi:hypothetical protein
VAVDPGYAEWLQAPERLVTVDDMTLATRWGDLAEAVAASSGIAIEADAIAEANRQIAFRGGPLVQEQIVVPKKIDVAAIRGSVRTIKIAGDTIYAAGADVFILGGGVDHGSGVTRLDILRKLT